MKVLVILVIVALCIFSIFFGVFVTPIAFISAAGFAFVAFQSARRFWRPAKIGR